MTKSNDDIPADELLLAEAIAAAKARGLGFTTGGPFKDANDWCTPWPDSALKCCALGALEVAGAIKDATLYGDGAPPAFRMVHIGNDRDDAWTESKPDHGESLGWAFRCAMTQEEP